MGFLSGLSRIISCLDWISPAIATVDQIATGSGEVAVPKGFEHWADNTLRDHGVHVRGQRYDPVHQHWMLRVADPYEAAAILRRVA